MREAFLFVESNTSGTGRLFATTARQLNLVPVVLALDPGRYSFLKEEGIDYRQVNTGDVVALQQALADLSSTYLIRGIYSSSEYFVETAAMLAAQLGLPGENFEAIRLCRNKYAQRRALKQGEIRIPRFCLLTRLQQLNQALIEIPPPVILKPNAGTGSVGVRLCRTREEAEEHAALLFSRTENERGAPQAPEVLLEAYMDGPEYSAEVLGNTVIGICAKHVSPEPFFVETGHDFPAPLPAPTLGRISQIALDSIHAVGLGWGAAHIEIRDTSQGAAIVEINPRLAGGFIPELVRLATGIDLIRATLQLAIGDHAGVQRTADRHASIRFLMCPGDGILSAVEGTTIESTENALAEIRMYRQPGDHVRIHYDFRDRIGHVIASAAGGAEARAAAAALRDRIHVRLATSMPSV